MDALDPKSAIAPSKRNQGASNVKKSLWETVKGIFTRSPTPPKRDFSNYQTPKTVPSIKLDVQKRLKSSQLTVYRHSSRFEDVPKDCKRASWNIVYLLDDDAPMAPSDFSS